MKGRVFSAVYSSNHTHSHTRLCLNATPHSDPTSQNGIDMFALHFPEKTDHKTGTAVQQDGALSESALEM